MRFAAVLAILCASPVAADSVAYRFTWQGAGGYEMRGLMAFDAALMSVNRVYETDLSCFEINGFKDGAKIGRWALGLLTPDTTWTLTFDPQASEFVVYGAESPMPQAWNMDGAGYNCGDPGFGFNIGSAAQDVCVDGELIFDSQVVPPQPFPVEPETSPKFSQDACRPDLLLGQLR